MIHLDTHVLAWLYEGENWRLPAPARALLEAEQPVSSPMAVLELEYLHEIGRLVPAPDLIVAELADRLGLVTATAPFPLVVREARAMAWTCDPFDRLIAGQARAEGARLLTADAKIREHLDLAVWS